MLNYIKVTPDGRLTNSGAVNEADALALQSLIGPVVFVDSLESDCNSKYWDGQKLVSKPTSPGANYQFDYSLKQWVPDFAAAWDGVRDQRNQLLQQSDWTQLPDVPIDTKEAWAVYRQALRVVTDPPDPFNIVWPVAPS
jgi:hypothetical protein